MIVSDNWDFTEISTKETTHGFHMYPAMMIPQVAQKLIHEFGKSSGILFDPYCGTGTSLVEANIKGLNGIGTDLNPLARLVAKTKTTIIEQQTLDLFLRDFYDFLFYFRFGIKKKESIVIPQFANIDYWFSRNVKNDLAVIKDYIESVEDDSISNFFKVAFSQTIRECSWTRKNEFKLYRMDKEKIKTFKPDVFTIFERVLKNNRQGMLDLIESKKNNTSSIIYDFNSVNSIPHDKIPEETIDIIVTSPPYGDSQTTVAYGQFSRLANEWLGVTNAQKIDSYLMGGRKPNQLQKFANKTLNTQINRIERKDPKRALDVCSFYTDYRNSIANISKVIKRNGIACFVVSNRCVKGVTIKTDKITKGFFEEEGFKHINTFKRKISSKRMPRKNSPSGISGQTTSLMNVEYIVVMKKTK